VQRCRGAKVVQRAAEVVQRCRAAEWVLRFSRGDCAGAEEQVQRCRGRCAEVEVREITEI